VTAAGGNYTVQVATAYSTASSTITTASMDVTLLDPEVAPSAWVTGRVSFQINLYVSDTPYAYSLDKLLRVTNAEGDEVSGTDTPDLSGWPGVTQLSHFVVLNDPELDGILMPRADPYTLSGGFNYRLVDRSGDSNYLYPSFSATLALTPTTIQDIQPPGPVHTPIPPALLLMGSGLGGLAVLGRRRRSRA
jgi:hypothetical protein